MKTRRKRISDQRIAMMYSAFMQIHRVGLVVATCLSFLVPTQLLPMKDEPRWMSNMSDAQKTSAGLSKLSESELQFLGKHVDGLLTGKGPGPFTVHVFEGDPSGKGPPPGLVQRGELGFSPLQKAAKNDTNPEAITELLKAGAEIEAKDPQGRTPLMIAASGNPSLAVIATLLEAGAVIEAKDSRQRTPLMLAAQFNPNPDVVLQLLKAGAQVEAKSGGGMTPLMHAALRTQSPEVIEHLIAAGAEVHAKSARGDSPVLLAAMNPKPEVVLQLLQAGAEIETRNSQGRTPLMMAAATLSHPETIEALLESGAHIEAKDKEGRTPLMIAAMNSREPIRPTMSFGGTPVPQPINESVTALLKAGANPRAIDADGKTALDYAKENEKFYKVSKAYKELDKAFHDQG